MNKLWLRFLVVGEEIIDVLILPLLYLVNFNSTSKLQVRDQILDLMFLSCKLVFSYDPCHYHILTVHL